MPRRFSMFLLALAFALSWLPADGHARCAPVSLPQDANQSEFVVEARLEHAGASARFRTTVVWKGGADAPAQLSLGARRGRGAWPWAEPAAEGRTFLLFLRRTQGGDYYVMRCGATAEARDPARAELRSMGLTPVRR